MSISSTVKKVMPYLKTASGYVLHRLSSQAVEMDDGTTLEQKVTSLNNLISQKIDTSDVVNNVLTTEEGFVLDARQGKVMDDKITELNGKLKLSHTFSISEEIDTGETWVDGKRIYRKVIKTTDVISTNETFALYWDTINCSEIWIDLQNSYIRSSDSGQVYPLCVQYQNYFVGAWVNRKGVRLYSNSGWNEAWTKVITVRYTKV